MTPPPRPRPLRRTMMTLAALCLVTVGVSAFLPSQPFPGLDLNTVFLCSFDGDVAGVDRSGPNLIKSTFTSQSGAGIYATDAGVVPANGAVGIYRTPAEFNVARGTVELWVKPDPRVAAKREARRNFLFSLRGQKSLDGDRYAELIVGEDGFQGATRPGSIYFVQPDGSLDLNNPATFPSDTPRGITTGDMNGDGWADLVICMINQNEVQVFHGPISAGQSIQPATILPILSPQGHATADLDEDGDLDLVVSSFDGSTPALLPYRNDGAGNFSSWDWGLSQLGPIPGAEGCVIDDVNGDGVLDILYGSFSKLYPTVLYFGHLSQGEYWIDPFAGMPFSTTALGASLADMDGNGWLDVVLARPLGSPLEKDPAFGRIEVFLNRGHGVFDPVPIAVPSPGVFTVSGIRDVNQDGYLDLVPAEWTTLDSPVKLGPDFQTTLPFLANSPVAFTVADLNADGIDDLFFRNEMGNTSPLYELDPWGAVLQKTDIPTLPTSTGLGVHGTVTGTSSYSSTPERSNSFELFVQDGELHWVVTDRRNVAHRVKMPFPGPSGDTVSGFHFVQAEWDNTAGIVSLSIGDPSEPANVTTTVDAPFAVSFVEPVFRVGTDFQNQNSCAGWALDDLRISDVRRSQNVCQEDVGIQGPGQARLRVCGQYLRPGNRATLTVLSDQPLARSILLASTQFNPTFDPFVGAVVIQLPWPYFRVFSTNAAGRQSLDINGNLLNGVPLDVYTQALVTDPAQPAGWAVSNAVKIRFQSP